MASILGDFVPRGSVDLELLPFGVCEVAGEQDDNGMCARFRRS
jgi:hypothetical protein